MKYTEEEFIELMDAVEALGGIYCEGEKHEINKVEFGHGNPAVLMGCGKPGLFEMPYGDGKFLRVCARCDDLGSWPRLSGNL